MSKKSERDIRAELVTAGLNTLSSYESYLLDNVTWRELAQTMTRLRKAIREVEALEKRQLNAENTEED
jgi:hypothetical protein